MKKLVCVASSAARCPGRGHQASVTSLTPVLSEGFHWEQGSHIAPQGTVEVTGALSPAGTNPVLIPEPVSQDCVPPLHFVSVRAGRARGQAASVLYTVLAWSVETGAQSCDTRVRRGSPQRERACTVADRI